MIAKKHSSRLLCCEWCFHHYKIHCICIRGCKTVHYLFSALFIHDLSKCSTRLQISSTRLQISSTTLQHCHLLFLLYVSLRSRVSNFRWVDMSNVVLLICKMSLILFYNQEWRVYRGVYHTDLPLLNVVYN